MTAARPTVVEAGIRNLLPVGARAGLRAQLVAASKSAQACSTAWALAHAAHKLGRWPSQQEYAEYWKITDRTAQREWARFREVFPGAESPDDLARYLASELGKRMANRDSAATALGVIAPAHVIAAA